MITPLFLEITHYQKPSNFYILVKGKLAEAGFNSRKFITNSDELRELIEKNERSRVNLLPNVGPQADQRAEKATESQTFAESSLNVSEKAENETESKVLGLVWNYKTDQLCFKLSEIANMARKAPLTERRILSVIARIYDPLGLLAPRVSTLKFIFQSLCNNEKNLDWNNPLPDTPKTQFLDCLSDLETMPILSIQRCYFEDVINAFHSRPPFI